MKWILPLFFFASIALRGQDNVNNEANKSFVALVMDWRNSEKIKSYINQSPELEIKINNVILEGLNGNLENGPNGEIRFPELFMDGLIDLNYELALDFLSDTHIGAIEAAYQKIIDHPKNNEVANLILGHMNRYKDKLAAEIEKLPSRRN